MVKGKEAGNYAQCQCCGNIYQANETISIEVSVLNLECPRCGYSHALNCGNEEDKYYFYNLNLDERYY